MLVKPTGLSVWGGGYDTSTCESLSCSGLVVEGEIVSCLTKLSLLSFWWFCGHHQGSHNPDIRENTAQKCVGRGSRVLSLGRGGLDLGFEDFLKEVAMKGIWRRDYSSLAAAGGSTWPPLATWLQLPLRGRRCGAAVEQQPDSRPWARTTLSLWSAPWQHSEPAAAAFQKVLKGLLPW